MKGTKTVDLWTCDLSGDDWKCERTSQEEMPVCVVCEKHMCAGHREQVTLTVSQPHAEPRQNNREAISLIDRTSVWVCSECRWPLTHAIQRYWSQAVGMLFDECKEEALAEKKEDSSDT